MGLGALVLASATLFTVLKWAGAVYFVWLGVKLIRSSAVDEPSKGTDSSIGATPGAQISRRGVLVHAAAVTALNPKSVAFFIAFVPQFLTLDAPLLPQCIILTATFVILAALNALAWALLADRLRARIARPRVIVWITRGGGVALLAMGLMTVFVRRSTA